MNSGASDVQVLAGTVLALSSEGSDAVVAPNGAGAGGSNTGNGTMSTPTFGGFAKTGVYAIKFTAATVFTVTDPSGDVLTKTGATGTAFLDTQVGFTITAGGTAFVAGDGFAIVVPPLLSRQAEIAGIVTAYTGTGNGTVSALTWANTFKTGAYTITLSSATAFTVSDPAGLPLGAGTVGTPYTSSEVNFLVTAGTIPFVNADKFVLTVPAVANHMQNWVNAAPASAVACNTEWVRAGTQKQIPALTGQSEVNSAHLVFDPSITGSISPTPQQLMAIAYEQLGSVGIAVR